jgi:hypothetical protein
MICTRCSTREALPNNRLGFCTECEKWRLAQIKAFTAKGSS